MTSADDEDDEDFLDPPFASPLRRSTLFSATFNLSATILGGGVLSLPLAFAKCGLALGSLLMIVAAVATEQISLLLCWTARQSGSITFGEVGQAAFGPKMETGLAALLCVFLLFVLTAFMVLVRDIWMSILQDIKFFVGNNSGQQQVNSDVVLIVILILMGPFLVQPTLHALRFNCYVGFFSVSILCLALCHHAWVVSLGPLQAQDDDHIDDDAIQWWPCSIQDVLFAFPIITLSFLSIFNILPVQNALQRPSRTRVTVVVDSAVGSTWLVMQLFGSAGYLYAKSATDGNILNNIRDTSGNNRHPDALFFLGRLGCGVTIMLGMAMILLPCRDSFLEVLDVLVNGPHHIGVHHDEEEEEENRRMDATQQENETTPLQASVTTPGSVINDEKDKEQERTRRRRRRRRIPILENNSAMHYGSTLGIVVLCFVAAVRVPGVAVVWSLCGSFLAFLVAYILPTACYLKIEHLKQQEQERLGAQRETRHGWSIFSWVVLIASTVAAVACTLQTVLRFFSI